MFGVFRAHRRARAAAGRLRAEWLTGDAQAVTLVGTATYDGIVARGGRPTRIASDCRHLAAASSCTEPGPAPWDTAVEIEIADGRVTEIERCVYRLGP